MISKPMLAATITSVDELDFSKKYLATPKLDGIRALMINGSLVSRTFKPIRNTHIRTMLEEVLPDGADGEIIVNAGDFQETTSGVMSKNGSPVFVYYWFDYVKDDIKKPYSERMIDLEASVKSIRIKHKQIIPLLPELISSKEELDTFETHCLNSGFEGVILRTAAGPYKCGRSTMREQFLMKFKRFQDDEAIIIGFEEKMHNDNAADKDAFGRTKRSTKMDGLTAANTLGSLIVKDIKTGVEFGVGTGFDDAQRKDIWAHRKQWMGRVITYKHFAQSGVLTAPRFPVFKSVRYMDDKRITKR
jgi:DNA ligase-1